MLQITTILILILSQFLNQIGGKALENIPPNVDWRTENIVTPVQNQWISTSPGVVFNTSWAFSAAGSIEGAYSKYMGQLVGLSVQNIIDCTPPELGKSPAAAMNYVKKNNGIALNSEYSYSGFLQKCRYEIDFKGGYISNYGTLGDGQFDELLHIIATQGPVSTAINVQGDFKSYSGGIYKVDGICDSLATNHYILIVGYGVSEKGIPYYIIKNSWGTSWGMGGYAYWDRTNPNMCGITQEVSWTIL